jgi:hypothetical protein
MPNSKSQSQSQKPPQSIAPRPIAVNVQPPKPDKSASVPKYDRLTEGYDPAKLKKR